MSGPYSPGLLSAIVASSDDAIVSKDLRGIVTSWNRAAERLFGFAAEEMVGQSITRIIPIERIAEEDYVLGRVREGLGVDHFETIRRRKDGTLVEVSLTVSPVRDGDGQIVGASKIARDISDRRRMERDAVRLAAIVESSSDAILAIDVSGMIQSWNGGAERMFGFSAAEAVGQPTRIIVPADRVSEEAAVLSRVFLGEIVPPFETVARKKDGGNLHVSLSVSPIRTSSGHIIGASAIARDVSEERRLRVAAEQAARAKDEFLAMLGHELRNPLAPILTALHLMQLKGIAEAEQERAMIERQVRHVVSLVDDLLDVSRITGGKISLHRQAVDLAEVVDQAVEMASPLLEERRHHLHVDFPTVAPLLVDGDKARLAQVLSNLLTNAAKYTEPGGRIEVVGQAIDGLVTLTVRDNGIGISHGMLPHVFDLFAQEHRTVDRARGGLGLGLAIVRSIVELHGGTVRAVSAGLGAGAEFQVRLPAWNPESASIVRAPTTPASEDRPSPPRLRILIVDDNDDAADALRMWLESAGHDARSAPDGPTALEVADQMHPDVALLDIGLPGMDGHELAARLRAKPALAAMRLVAVTGYGQEADFRRSRAAGFDAHFVKPVDVATLTRTLDEFSRDRWVITSPDA